LPRPLGAIGVVALGGKLHAIGGADGTTQQTRSSVNTHLVYDPETDRWESRAPLPTARDHIGIVVAENRIHVLAGRINSFLNNSQQHDSYDPQADAWTVRNPVPSARSGLGSVVFNGKIFCIGGEGWRRVYGLNEAYDLAADSWASYAPMPTPRHGMGAVAIGNAIYVAGGGPVMGGGYLSAVHEAFTLDAMPN
jgi:N-acetylneuraminic acid mutarotase